MAVRPMLVCDVDGKDDAEAYDIIYPDGTVWAIDLCKTDAKVLESYRTKAQGQVKPKRQAGRRAQFTVTDLRSLVPPVQPKQAGGARKAR